MAKGKKTGGRVAGVANKVTVEFKEALNALLIHAAPNMIEWLDRIAVNDPAKALDHVGKLAEYVHPKLARTEQQLLDGSGKPTSPSFSVTINGVPSGHKD